MKTLLAILLFAAPAFAQDQAAAALAAAGCGPNDVQFSVKTNKKNHPIGQPLPGKALVYVFYQDPSNFCIGGCITIRVGVDGSWVGANQGNSYFYFPVDPGDHKVCMDWQSKLEGRANQGSALSLNAEAGKTYYIRVRVYPPERSQSAVYAEPVDPAEGPILVVQSAYSTSTQKKK